MTSTTRRTILGASLAPLGAPALAQPRWPARPVQLLCPWAAGGGTDAVARIIAAGLEKELGQPVNVVNRVGAGGVIAHSAMATAAPDGYTIGMATAEFSTYYWGALADVTYKDITPIALVNFDPAAFHVSTTSEWNSLKDALEAIRKAPPGTYKLGGIPIGAGWHLALGGFLKRVGIDPNVLTVVPMQGAAPGFQALAAGGVHIVPSSLPEGRAMVEAGKVKALAVIAEERTPAFPNVPTVQEAVGVSHSGGSWRAIVGPKGLPQDIQTRLLSALKKVHASAEFRDFMTSRGFGLKWAEGEEVRKYLADDFERVGEIMAVLQIKRRD